MIVRAAALKRLEASRPAALIRPPSALELASLRCFYRPGRSYQVATSVHNTPRLRARVVSARLTTLDHVSAAEAEAAGFASLGDLQNHWQDRYGQTRKTWVVALARDPEQPDRYLHRDSTRGYTTRPHDALPGEPAAVDPETQARFAREAREADARRAAERRADRLRRRLEAELPPRLRPKARVLLDRIEQALSGPVPPTRQQRGKGRAGSG